MLVWASVKEHCRLLGGLNNKDLFLTVLEAGKSKTKALEDLESSESPLPGSWMVIFSLCPDMAEVGKGTAWDLF